MSAETITQKQIRDFAEKKMADLNAFDVDHSQCLESISDPVGQHSLVWEVQLESLQ